MCYPIELMRFIACSLSLVALWGCGEDTYLDATDTQIKADGTSSTTITYHSDQDDGTSVYFQTDSGHFLDAGYEVQTLTRSLAGGAVSVELYSSIYPGTATVLASTDYGGNASTTVEFVALRASGRALSFECDQVNIGALAQPVPDYAVHCHLSMQDRDGAVVDPRGLTPGEFGFSAEAGLIQPAVVDDGYGNVHFLYTARGGQNAPVDVTPIEGEPSRPGDTGGTRNPRDGLVTLVAWVRGEEGFHDINSNGLYEPSAGETFIDIGEPFVDVDDDGVFDPGSGDTYTDLDGDHRYTGPNGRWDEDAVIWATFKLLWTGTAHESSSTSRIEIQGGDRDIPSGATRMVTAALLDQNMNPVAALPENTITLYPGCSSCDYTTSYTFTMENTRGFGVDGSGQILGNLFEAPVYSLSITNTNTYEEPETFSITVTAWVTPAAWLSDGTVPSQQEFSLAALEARLLGQRAE